MTRIDFYILRDRADQACPLFACRLADKAYQLGHQIYIHTESEAQTRQLDDLLWTFRPGSFLPHAIAGAALEEPVPPILLGHAAEPPGDPQVLINLAIEVPLFFSRFERVAEVIDADATRKLQGRERYRFYRERGYELSTHNL